MTGTTLFFTPHQDDELLTMGNSIVEHAKIEDTHIILCTDGSKSYIKRRLNDDGTCSYHVGIHDYFLTEEQFSQSRDIEFEESCEAMGVKQSNIHMDEGRTMDGHLTKKRPRKIIENYLEKYPDAKVKTTTPFGPKTQHEDHKVLGEAALELYKEGKIKDLRFYIEPYIYESFKEANPKIKTWAVLSSDEEAIYKAIKSYKIWDPENRFPRFAIGYHSVRKNFKELEENKIQYIHAPEEDQIETLQDQPEQL